MYGKFVPRPVMASFLVLLDAEFNSASNRSSFKEITLEKYEGLGENTVFLACFATMSRKILLFQHVFTI